MKNPVVILLFSWVYTLQGQHALFTQESLSINYNIHVMTEDNNGFLWLGTDQGVVYYNGYEDIIIDDGLPCYSLLVRNNVIYAGRDSGVISIINTSTKTLAEEIHLNISSGITGIQFIKEKLIIGTYGDGFFFQSDNGYASIDQKLSDFVYEFVGHENSVYAATDRGLLKFNDKGELVRHYEDIKDPIVTDLSVAGDSAIIIGCYSGIISILDLTSDTIINIDHSLPESNLIDIQSAGQKIIVTSDDGVFDVSDPHNPVALSDGNSYSDLTGVIFCDSRHNLWIAVKHKGLMKSDLRLAVYSDLADNIQSITSDGTNLFLGTATGVHSINMYNRRKKSVLSGVNVTVVKYYENHLFVGTYANGLFVLDDNMVPVVRFDQINGLANNTVLDLEKVNNNKLMISTLAGVSKLTYDFTQGQYLQQDSTYSPLQGYSYIMDIFEKSNGEIWYGRDRNGLLIQSTSEIEEITVYEDQQKLGTVFSIVESDRGDIYFSSSRLGILKWQNQKIQLLKGLSDTKNPYLSLIPLSANEYMGISRNTVDKFFYYDSSLVVQNVWQVNNGSAAYINNYCKSKNHVWYVFNDEVFQYTLVEDEEKNLPVAVIESMEVNLERTPLTINNFSQSNNNLSFKFTGNWMKNPRLQKYAYTLVGLDQEWRYTNDRVVTYPKLTPGRYTLKVKTSYNDDFTYSPETIYTFKIERHFYNTWWFYGMVFFSILTGVYFFTKKRNQEKLIKAELSQKKIETQLINLKNQLNPHFLFNSFNTLMGLIEEDSQKSISYIECLTDFYRLILDIGKSELIPYNKELELVKLYAYLLKERFGEGFNLYIGNPDLQLYVPPLTIQMLVENAVKHNVVNLQKPLKINVDVLMDKIVVFNNLNPKINQTESTKIGLNNINKRYQLLVGKSIEYQKTATSFVVKLPVIKSNEFNIST